MIPNNRRWFRISLRSFLIAFTCLSIAVGWLSNDARKRVAAFAAIRNAGGVIQMDLGEPSRFEKWFGPELFGAVNKVDLRKGKAKVSNSTLAHVGLLTELRRLDLSYADIDDEGLRHIAHLPLRELWLQNTRITDASSLTISGMQHLDFLALNATALTDTFLERIESLPELEDLGLRGTHITGAGMKFLARHPKLKKLDVYHTQVDDSGVERLVECQSLTDVGLSMTKITNHVFEYLDMLPNLTEVDLGVNEHVTTEAVVAFKTKHPTWNVEWHGR